MRKASEPTVTTVSQGPNDTYPYMAPEMFTTSHRGPAVDVYSLGCLLIELFGRHRVWPGLDGMQIMQRYVEHSTSHQSCQTSATCLTLTKLCVNGAVRLTPTQRPTVAARAAMMDGHP